MCWYLKSKDLKIKSSRFYVVSMIIIIAISACISVLIHYYLILFLSSVSIKLCINTLLKAFIELCLVISFFHLFLSGILWCCRFIIRINKSTIQVSILKKSISTELNHRQQFWDREGESCCRGRYFLWVNCWHCNKQSRIFLNILYSIALENTLISLCFYRLIYIPGFLIRLPSH